MILHYLTLFFVNASFADRQVLEFVGSQEWLVIAMLVFISFLGNFLEAFDVFIFQKLRRFVALQDKFPDFL